MKMEFIRNHWVIISSVLTTSLVLVRFALARTFARVEVVNKVNSRLDALESVVHHQPTRDELHLLQLEISNLRGDLREFSAVIQSARHINDLLLENELKQRI